MQKRLYFLFIMIFIFAMNIAHAETLFIRGDANYDGSVDISDSIFINYYLFKGGEKPQCMDAADANDDGSVDISDGIKINEVAYLGIGSFPAPYPNAGIDPTADGLTCGTDGAGGIEGACKSQSKETAEGPGGQYCTFNDYEECYDYLTKSTVIAYNCDVIGGCFEAERKTDVCSRTFFLECMDNY